MLNLVSKKTFKSASSAGSLRRKALAGAAFSALSVALLGAAAVVTALPASAVEDYSTVNLQGRIVDGSGNPIANAKVDVTSDRNATRSTVSNSDGRFAINSLPNGDYRIRITAAGYKTYEDTTRLAPGSSSYNFELVAGTDSSSSDAEKVVVYGKRSKTKVFDRTAQGQVFNTSDLESQIPVTRGTTGIALLAPGVTAGDTVFGFLPSTAGSAVNENTYYINGFNVTSFRNYLGFSNIPFEFFDTLEVKTGGYQAEFGRATGGALITTTKSGSDEFHAGIIAYASPQSLRDTADNVTFRSALPTRVSSLNDHDYRDTSDVTVYASGALIPDHLYVYGVYSDLFAKQGDTVLTSSTGGQRDELVTQDATYGVKVDAFLDPDHHFEFTHFRDDDVSESNTYDTDGAGAITGFAGTTVFGTGGDANVLRYTGKYTEWLTLSGLYGHVSYDQFAGSASDDICPTVLDFRPGAGGAELSCAVNFTPESGGDEREAWRLDADFFYTFFGKHTTRVGYDNEKLNSVNTLKYSGGLYFRVNNSGVTPDIINWDGAPPPIAIPAFTDYVRIRRLESGGSFETTNTSWYIQDAWKIMDGPVTLLAGLRLDIFDHTNALGEKFLKIEDQYAPRLGVSWDVFRDGKTKAYGFYGKYYLPIASNTNIRLAGSEEFTQSYFNCTTNPCSFNPDGTPILVGYAGYPTLPETAPGNLGTATLSPGGVQDPRKIVSANLNPMDEEEFLLGLERTMDDGWFEGWTLGLNMTYRKLGNVIEDVLVDEAMLEYCTALAIVGCGGVWSGQHQYVLANPGQPVIFYTDELPGAPPGFMRIELSGNAMKLPPAEREYTAVEFKWQRPFDGVWGLDGSYTWSRGEGNYEGGVKSDIGQADTSITQDFDHRASVDYAYGLLPNHREHKLKIFGSYAPIPELVLGGNIRVESPRHFGCFGTNPAPPASSSDVGATTSSWYCPIGPAAAVIPTPRGSQFEGEWLSNLDLSAIYNWNMGESMGGTTTTFRIDVFNVLNDGAATDFDESGELTLGTPDPNYKNKTQFQAPRSVRLGIAVRY